MTEKRFTLAYETNDQNCIWWAVRDGDITLWKEEVVGFLNELAEEKEYYQIKSGKCEEELLQLRRENEQLKSKNKRYKRLSSIRREALDNRILTLKEFINKHSKTDDEAVNEVLNKLLQLEIKEYDISKENRKLREENEQLKKQIKIFDEFLDGNNLDIDWNELCILDSCIMNDGVECRDCIYMGMECRE